MLVIKTFALSQLVFSSQFVNINTKDIKKIERLCYSFLWGSGPERVKRAFLKNSRVNGGINGVDVDAFFLSIQIRQFVKADRSSDPLRIIQREFPSREDITRRARYGLYKLCRAVEDIDIGLLSSKERGELACSHISMFVKPGSVADKLITSHNIGSIAELIDSELGRGLKNKIIKGLPLWIRPLLLDEYDYESACFNLVRNKAVFNLGKCSSRQLQDELKQALKCVLKFEVSNKYQVEHNESLETLNWKHVWQIGHPNLLGTRLKVLYKDVYSNERRYRFGISDSPNCPICGKEENVQHQLFDCSNAKRLWIILEKVTGYTPADFYHSICYEGPIETELVKSVVLKLLVQIDRSSKVTTKSFLQMVKWYIHLEESCNKAKGCFASIKVKIDALLN